MYVSTDLRVSYIYRYKGASLHVMEAFSVSVYRFKGMLMSIDGRVCASVYRVKGVLVSIDLRMLHSLECSKCYFL